MINVGIAGLGFMGMIHYLAYQKLRGVRVKAICETIPERLKGDWRGIQGNFGPQGKKMDLSGVDTYSDLDEMLGDGDLDMIDVCLPPSMHGDVSIRAMQAGHHVLCEKPICLETTEARKMVRAANRSGKTFMVAHVLPFFAAYRFAYRTITSGKYGKPLGGRFTRIISDPLWLKHFWNAEVCGGPMLDLHIHDAHFIRLLFGMPSSVRTVGRVRNGLPEFFDTQFLFDEDPSLTVTATGGVINQQGRPFTNGYEIHLEKATIVFDSWMEQPVTVLTNNGRVSRPKFSPGNEIDDFAAELQEAVRSVRSGEPSALLDGALARDALIICHRETQSLLRGRPVRV